MAGVFESDVVVGVGNVTVNVTVAGVTVGAVLTVGVGRSTVSGMTFGVFDPARMVGVGITKSMMRLSGVATPMNGVGSAAAKAITSGVTVGVELEDSAVGVGTVTVTLMVIGVTVADVPTVGVGRLTVTETTFGVTMPTNGVGIVTVRVTAAAATVAAARIEEPGRVATTATVAGVTVVPASPMSYADEYADE